MKSIGDARNESRTRVVADKFDREFVGDEFCRIWLVNEDVENLQAVLYAAFVDLLTEV